MGKRIISLILLLAPVMASFAATTADLKENAPEQYTVVRGDTLWSIAGRFLNQPWRWPELWKMNQEQIKNPHLIYPGDVIVLDRSASEVRLQLSRLETTRLSPKVRVEPLARAVPSIPPSAIAPFLAKPLVVGEFELDSAARIAAAPQDRTAMGTGDIAYVEGVTKDKGRIWQIFRRGNALVDPGSGETLGYEATYLGEARVLEFGDVSTVEIVRSTQEIQRGDRLLPAAKEVPTFAYVPRAPAKSITGHIVSTYGSLGEAGPLSIVALSKGSKDGLEVGHVLAVYRNHSATRLSMRTSPLYGRQGLSGDDAPRAYYAPTLTPRDGPVYPQSDVVSAEDISRLPPVRVGVVMVFRTFDRAAFGLIMEASQQVGLNDVVRNP